jgi:hypothetical protein
MQTCRVSTHQTGRKQETKEDVHDELGVLPIPEILEIVEVVHERFILKELTLSEDYRSDGIKGSPQLRYCGFERD